MDIRQIYKLAIEFGIKNDFRTLAEIREQLKYEKKKFEKMSDKEKKYFDREKLINPYSDTRIHYDSGCSVKRVLAGIDIESSELMVARYLSNHSPKTPIDACLTHHPIGMALSRLAETMSMQIDLWEKHGIPVNVAENLTQTRIGEVSRGVDPANHFQSVDTAKLLDINYANIHAPADNAVAKLIKEKVKKNKPKCLNDVIDLLLDIPEYSHAARMGFGPRIVNGSPENRVGKNVLVGMVGGTNGSEKIYEKMAQAGISTYIDMHQSEAHLKEAKKHHINVVIAGHISSDSLGMNLFLDELEKKGIEIVPCSGLIRISRNKKKKQ